MASLEGTTLGKYRLIEQLGRGGFASVYKAYQARLDRYIAIKVLHPHLVEGEDFLARFEREAIAVAALRHPNIVIVHDFDVETGVYYMVMEFIDGQSLKERLEYLNLSGEHMPLSDVGRIMGHTTSALDYAHSQGMLHRDVKPSNVILNTTGDAFLTDFGIARILSSSQFTVTGALIGTPAYMSPEQGQGMSVSPASDVYSLGVMLYEFLTGRVPFDADTPLAIIFKHIRDPLPSILSLRPDLPEAVERVIYKSLAKDPDDRFQSPGEMMQALQAALDQVQIPEPQRPSSTHEMGKTPVGVPLETPSSSPADAAVDFESGMAPTLAVDGGADITPIESPAAQSVLEPEVDEPDLDAANAKTIADEGELLDIPAGEIDVDAGPPLSAAEVEFSKAPTLAVEGESLDMLAETMALDEGQVLPGGEVEATKASTVAIVPESSEAPERVEPLKGRTAAGKKVRSLPKFFGIAAIVLVGVILLGVVLTQVFSPGVGELTTEVAVEPTIRPTRRPTLTPASEPAEMPGVALFEHGMVLLHDEGEYSRAIDKFNEAEELGFNSPELYGNRAWACHEAGIAHGDCSFEQAIRDFNLAIEQDSEHAGYYAGRGWTYYDIERWGEAIQDFSRAIEIEPENPDHWAIRADIFIIVGDIDSALADINHAIELDPDVSEYHAAKARAFDRTGDIEAAIENYGAAIELDSENPELWWERGWRFLGVDNLDAAMADFDQAIDLAPEAVPAYVGRAHTYIRMEDFDAALHEMDIAVSLDTRNDRLFIERAHVYWWNLGDKEAALQDLNKAIELNPENWEAYMNRGEVYAYEFEDHDLGLENFNQAVEVAPRDVDLPFVLRGMFYNHIENWELAIEDLTKAIRISRESPDSYGHRGFAFANLDMVDKARADFELFLELTDGNPEYEPWRRDVQAWLDENF